MAEELQREMTGIGGISAVAAATAAVLTTKVEDKMKSPRMTKPAATTTVAPKASLRTTLPKTQTSLIPVPKTPVPPKPFTGTLNFKKTVSERNGTKITTSRPITASKPSLTKIPKLTNVSHTTSTLSKSRVPLTSAKTIGGSAFTGKSNLIFSPNVQSKVSTFRTPSGFSVPKTTKTTIISTIAKKPAEHVKGSVTKITKIEKPKENRIPTIVTEEVTVANDTSAVIDNQINSRPELMKDNSPTNKPLIETSL
uniref:Mucin-5AC-like isoform X2 n=1 Tax=Diabrotica virgifera virgifera TaxID=50390 RepID=A0A6P7FNR3_DIAVI